MTGPARDSIEQVAAVLVDRLREGLRRDGVKAPVSIGLGGSARQPARARLELVMHRASPDTAARNSVREPGGAELRGAALRLGFIAVVRGPGDEGDLRLLTSAVRALEAGPVLGPDSRWRVTIERPADELRFAFFSAARLPVSPCVWFEVTGVAV